MGLAYLIPYGLGTLAMGPLAERIGRRPVIIVALGVLTLLTAGTATAGSAGTFILWRLATGFGACSIVPVSLMLIGDVFDYARRGAAIGWLFGGMAGGMAVGSTAGALAEPVIGWRGLFLVTTLATTVLTALAVRVVPRLPRATQPTRVRTALSGYRALLRQARARRTFAYVGFNAVLHSGVYTWLGVFLHQRFDLGPTGIGLALLGYGVPGFLLGPLIGVAADRFGRARLIPAGLAVAAVAVAGLATSAPLGLVVALITVLSLGYDLTQPLLAGIATDLDAPRGMAVAGMAVVLFTGFGVGSLVFQAALRAGFPAAFAAFALAAIVAAAVGLPTLRDEQHTAAGRV